MRFCAPTANWDMKSSDSWWPLIGTAPTSAGVRISQDVALTYSAVFACTRVISETLASLPLNLMRQDGASSTKATDHPLYPLLHDMPNPEMDIFTFIEMQEALTLNWGNCYAEIQRDSSRRIAALWPIHPSRIPTCNIERNTNDPRHWDTIQVGQPGEIVYWVRADDGTEYPIPASDMLHVAGVLSRNGITGMPIPLCSPEAIGIGMATEQHAGAFFRNGAAATIALSSPKVIGKEVAERLREQWQRVYGGVKNHYKTLLLEEGMEPKIFSMSPEASQLIDQRALNHRVVATQLYRVPGHKIGDTSASTFNNVEQAELAFARDTMLAWVRRWECAIHRQLLTAEEQKRYRPRFNMMGLLRGDSQTRGQFYQLLFNIGAFSPNDIRELEDMNPIKGGDQYFVPANNLVPLDKIGEMAQAQIDKLNEPAPAPVAPAKSEPDADEVANRLAERAERREFLEKVMLRDAEQAAKDAARAEFDRQMRERDIAEFGKPIEELTAKVAALTDSVKSQPAPVIEVAAPIVDAAPIVRQVVEAVKNAEKEAVLARETAEIERLAAERAVFEREKAEKDAEREQARVAAQQVLEVAIRREIEQLAAWESNWISKAIDKPREWQDAKSGYYLRFSERFVDRMAEFEPSALSCGVKIDAKAAADAYSKASLRDLKVTDKAAGDNYHDELGRQVSAIKSEWGPRAAALAKDMVERGSKAFRETQSV